jgi:choice-of-anchor B domain-containing protein
MDENMRALLRRYNANKNLRPGSITFLLLVLVLALMAPHGTTGDPLFCENASAGDFPCANIDLLSHLDLASFGETDSANDLWGWTSSSTSISDNEDDREFAILGLFQGTAFVEVTDPVNPIYLGLLPSKSSERADKSDIKTYKSHAFIVSEGRGQGMQIFDLETLLTLDKKDGAPHDLEETAHYDLSGSGRAHNIMINNDSGFAYITDTADIEGGGSDVCLFGLHMVDVT